MMKKFFHLIPIAYGIIIILFLKSRVDQIVDEIFESSGIKVKVWYQSKKYVYDRQSPLIFIGGVPRSGTTLLRVMIEGHPSITCGEETGIIPDIIKTFSVQPKTKMLLTAGGVTQNIIDDAVAEFILRILTADSRPNILCNKDPFDSNHTAYEHRLFPNSKHLLIIRDRRGSVNSMIKHNFLEPAMGPGIKNFESGLMAWNFTVANMVGQCFKVGSKACMIIYYELLVSDPQYWLKRVASFLCSLL